MTKLCHIKPIQSDIYLFKLIVIHFNQNVNIEIKNVKKICHSHKI